MDIEFSQIGQNVAVQNTGIAPVRPEEVQESNTGFEAQRRVEENNKASANLADNSEELNSNSINIESAVAEISEFVQAQNRQLAFSIDEASQRSVVKVKITRKQKTKKQTKRNQRQHEF
eukprot:TRINITY_DN51925_c0_g1_i1.p5 TRINITY_DN51925_c0_g1~~TRINITY_DN51925_c0_g1_i1.p5  ORF type:complete len:119 (+),score=11.23 TRINITY_DN51925_c0_g1_i1:465-821(+)